MWLQDFCLDLFEPSGHGKRRKRLAIEPNKFIPKNKRSIKEYNNSTPFTKFKENIEYTVMMPNGKFQNKFNVIYLNSDIDEY